MNDPRPGVGSRFIGTACHNCGETLTGKFCHNCGQPATALKQTVKGLLKDYGRSAFSLDALVWKTLRCLLFKPGKLTEEYLSGRRVRYIAPLRLYLTWSFLFFLILSFIPAENMGIRIDLGDNDGAIADTSEVTIAQRDSLQSAVNANGILNSAGVVDSTFSMPGLRTREGEVLLDGVTTDDIVSGILAQMPKAMFFLVPLSAALIHLFYIRRRRPYLSHLVNALSLHTFAFIALSIAHLLQLIPGAVAKNIAQAIIVMIPVYAVISFRRIYRGGWLKTIGKVVVMMLIYLVCLGFTVAAIYFLFFRVFNRSA